MPLLVSQQFRPTVIIFIGDDERRVADVLRDLDDASARRDPTIYTRFRDLCAGLDGPLRQCVELIAVREGTTRATRLPLDDWSYREADEGDEGDDEEDEAVETKTRRRSSTRARISSELPQEGDFTELFGTLLRKVQGAWQLRDIEAQGYKVPETQAQIHIVSRTTSQTVAQVSQLVVNELRDHRFSTLISFLLLDHPRYPDRAPGETIPLTADATPSPWGTQPATTQTPRAPLIESIPGLDVIGEPLPAAPLPAMADDDTQTTPVALPTSGGMTTGTLPGMPSAPNATNGAPADTASGAFASSGAVATVTAPTRRAPPPWLADLSAQPGKTPQVNFCFMYEEFDQSKRAYRESDIRYAIAETLFALVATGLQAAPTFREVTQVSPRSGRPKPTEAEILARERAVTARKEREERLARAASASAYGAEADDPFASLAAYSPATDSATPGDLDFDDPFARSSAGLAAVPPMLSDTEEIDSRIGSIGTSMAFFPRAAVERYCANTFGAELLKTWRLSLGERPLRWLDRTRVRTDAARVAKSLEDGVRDSERRPGAPEHLYPTLGFLEDNDLRQDLYLASREVFSQLSRNAVANHMRDDDDRDTWAQFAEQQSLEARGKLTTWREAAEIAWEKARSESEQTISKAIGDLWFADEQGLSRAQIYARRMDEALTSTQEHLLLWRREHAAEYEAKMRALNKRATGPWESDSEVAAASLHNVAYVVSGSHETLRGYEQDPRDYLPQELRKTTQRLAMRAAWARARVPGVGQLFAAGAMATPALLVLALGLLWGAGQYAWRPLIITAVGVVVVVALCCALARAVALRTLRDSEEDHLRAYRLYYAYLCAQWEDQLRVALVNPLARVVKNARERLDDIQRFIQRLENDMRDAAQATEDDLFEGPSGLRDVFIANGLELTMRRENDPGGYHLEDFYRTVNLQREATPHATWQRNDLQIQHHLRKTLAEQRGGVIHLSNAAFEARIRAFAREVIRPYLKGDLVSAEAALGARNGVAIWRGALSRSTILYRPDNDAPQYLYVAANDGARKTQPASLGVLQDATPIRTSHPEWLLLTRFQIGGARSRWGTWMSFETTPLEDRLPSRPNWDQPRRPRPGGQTNQNGGNGHTNANGRNGHNGANGNGGRAGQADVGYDQRQGEAR